VLRSSQAALAYQTGSIYLADANYNVILPISVDATGRQTLLEALTMDAGAQSLEDRYSQPEQIYGTLLFTNSPATDMTKMGFSFSSAVVPLTPSFTQTHNWLESAGLITRQAVQQPGSDATAGGAAASGADAGGADASGADADDTAASNIAASGIPTSGIDPALIEEMTFMPDNPYASVVARQSGGAPAPTSRFFIASRSDVPGRFWAVSDFGSLKSISDSGKIAQIAPNLRTACFMTGGYFVQAKLRGIEAYVYYYLPEHQAPAFVKGGGM
jgi:ABC-2 type transport system permease protein